MVPIDQEYDILLVVYCDHVYILHYSHFFPPKQIQNYQ